jgi:WD40 repeat protein
VVTNPAPSSVYSARFSANGRFLAAGCGEYTLIYVTTTGEKIRVPGLLSPFSYLHIYHSLTSVVDDYTTPRRSYLCPSTQMGPSSRRALPTTRFECVFQYHRPSTAIYGLIVVPRLHIYPSQLTHPVYRQIWDIATKRILSTFEGHEDSVISLKFSCDTRLILSSSLDNTARIWHMETGHKLLSIAAPSDESFIVTYHCAWYVDTRHCAYVGCRYLAMLRFVLVLACNM